MKITIAVDANIVMSALLGGKPSFILFDSRFDFATTEFTLTEVKKYFPKLSRKTSLPKEDLLDLLGELPLTIYPKIFYKNHLKKSQKLIGEIDAKDVEILALALKLEAYLWSQDRHFDNCGYKKILKTYHFLYHE